MGAQRSGNNAAPVVFIWTSALFLAPQPSALSAPFESYSRGAFLKLPPSFADAGRRCCMDRGGG
jgi:hypothetical protein